MSSGDVQTVIGLIRAIRAEHGNLPVVGHRDWMGTECPGRWYSHLAELSNGSGFGAVSSPCSTGGRQPVHREVEQERRSG